MGKPDRLHPAEGSNSMTQAHGVLLDCYRIVVVRLDGSSECFGRFASTADAEDWAMRQRDRLRLGSSASWYVQEVENG